MIRKLNYSEKDAMIDIIKGRDKFMLSSSSLLPSYRFLEDEVNFNNNISFGFFDEENILDAFIFANIWSEIPAYSWVVFTKKKDNRIKDSQGVDKNLSLLCDYTVDYIGNVLGYWEHYKVAPEGWRYVEPNVIANSIVDVIENIPANELSKYALFRTRLLNRRLNHPTIITRHLILPEYRNAKFNHQ